MDRQLKALSEIVKLLPELGVEEIVYLANRLKEDIFPRAEVKCAREISQALALAEQNETPAR